MYTSLELIIMLLIGFFTGLLFAYLKLLAKKDTGYLDISKKDINMLCNTKLALYLRYKDRCQS